MKLRPCDLADHDKRERSRQVAAARPAQADFQAQSCRSILSDCRVYPSRSSVRIVDGSANNVRRGPMLAYVGAPPGSCPAVTWQNSSLSISRIAKIHPASSTTSTTTVRDAEFSPKTHTAYMALTSRHAECERSSCGTPSRSQLVAALLNAEELPRDRL